MSPDEARDARRQVVELWHDGKLSERAATLAIEDINAREDAASEHPQLSPVSDDDLAFWEKVTADPHPPMAPPAPRKRTRSVVVSRPMGDAIVEALGGEVIPVASDDVAWHPSQVR